MGPSSRSAKISRSSLSRALGDVLAMAFVGLGLAATSWAQGELPGVYSEILDVRVVNLEVVVTDGDGVRVSGLQPEDFILTVDGQEVPIEYFSEVFGGTAVERGDETASGALPARQPGEAVGTSYLVFIDEYFSLPIDRNRVLRRMVEQLPLLGEQDRMAVVAYDGGKLEMLSTWSSSVEALTRVFEDAEERPARGLERQAERRLFEITRDPQADTELDPTSRAVFQSSLDLEEEQLANLVADQVERVLLAATSALRGFANPPGRKVMMLMSGRWPLNPALWVSEDPTRSVLSRNVAYGDELYSPLVDTANRIGYTLYPVDMPGLGSALADLGRADFDGVQRDRQINFDREREEELLLRTLAVETGGRPLLDSASVHAFERIVEDTRSYYWLGFTPSWQGDDASHDVKLKARRKGLKVRARKGFSDLSRKTEVTMLVESTLLFGSAPSAAALGVEVGTAKRAGFGKVNLQGQLQIPAEQLTFLPTQDGFAAQLELRVAVLDEQGSTAEIPVLPFTIQSNRLPTAGSRAPYETNIRIRKRKHDIVFSLYDLASGQILSTRVEVDP